MCFFQDILLSISLIYCLYNLYINYVQKETSRKKVENYVLFLVGSFAICILLPSLVRYFFLDLFILLAYRKNRYIEGLLLSFILTICFLCIENFPWIWLMILLIIYFGIFIMFPEENRKKEEFSLLMKGFFLSILLYQNAINTIGLYLILFFLLLVEDIFLLQFTPQIVLVEEDSNTMTELEKNLFKITHEIKNPITVCKGYLDMMNLENKEKTEKYLSVIKNEIARTLVIMEDFMSIRSVTIHPDIMDFYLLIEDIEGTVQFLLKKYGCQLIIPNEQEELYIYADYDRLKQVFINLIKNSVEAGATKIEIKVKAQSKKLRISVEDTGEGIKEETLSHLGELFYTTKTSGTGVGVHLSKEIIRMHQGSIKYRSKVGKGTKVIIMLPIGEEDYEFKI